MPDDRDHQPPKSGPLHERPKTQPVAGAVVATGYEDVTGRFDTLEAEAEARFRRDVIRSQRALGIKIAAGNRVIRDELRGAREERERRRDAEVERARLHEAARVRRARIIEVGLKSMAGILAAIGGIITAYAALRGHL